MGYAIFKPGQLLCWVCVICVTKEEARHDEILSILLLLKAF